MMLPTTASAGNAPTPPDISAKCAETPKRGRPVKFSPELRAMYATLYPEVRSKRGLEDTHYMVRAYGILRGRYNAAPAAMPWAAYYIDHRGGNIFHQTILSLLGRIEHDDDFLIELAREIAEQHIPTGEAVSLIRTRREMNLMQIVMRLVAEDNAATQAQEGSVR